MQKYVITLSEDQLATLNAALEMYARVGMGQLDVAIGEFAKEHAPNLQPGATNDNYHRSSFDDAILWLKHHGWGHAAYGSWGIHNEKVPEACRAAWDMKKLLDGALRDTCKGGYSPAAPRLVPIMVERVG